MLSSMLSAVVVWNKCVAFSFLSMWQLVACLNKAHALYVSVCLRRGRGEIFLPGRVVLVGLTEYHASSSCACVSRGRKQSRYF